jgi:calnexin
MKFNIKFIFLVSFALCLVIPSGFCESDDEVVVENEAPFEEEKVEENKKEKYVKPTVSGEYHFMETFETESVIGTKWLKSNAKKEDVDEVLAKYDGEWAIESSLDAVLDGDLGLVLKSKAKHHAIAAKLDKPFKFSNKKNLVIQYEVKFQNPLECGGAYVKLLADDSSLESFYDKSSFSVMFGPDKCGTDNKYHFIIRFKNPVTGRFEEKHAKKSELLDSYFNDGKTHLYTLVVRPDNTFKMMIDLKSVNSGSLLVDFEPAINPPKEIVDPEDKKPETWDEREKLSDPEAVKPEDWNEEEPKLIADPQVKMPDGWLEDEPETIADPFAIKPEDWDEATDGLWEAPKIDNEKCKDAAGCGKWNPPMINNPLYKGKWKAPLIANPNYQGKWEARRIENPEFFEEKNPFSALTTFSAIGLELWSMTDQIYFDNFLITDDEQVALEFSQNSWEVKRKLELIGARSSDSVVDGLLNATADKPWLWAVYILVVLLPIVIIAVFCCGGKSGESKKSEKETTGQAKKTDAKTPDDPLISEPIEEEEEGEGEGEEEEEEEEEAELIDEEDGENQIDKSDLEPKENEEVAESEQVTKKKSTQKRKTTRKD